tara:strand:- start:78 stop:530 length:453 start_codon:yes stop_codon:yes gene_type:complete
MISNHQFFVSSLEITNDKDFYNHLKNLFVFTNILNERFSSYIELLLKMFYLESNVFKYIILIILLYVLIIKFKFVDKFNSVEYAKLCFVPLFYSLCIIIFLIYISYVNDLSFLKNWVISSYDRYTLTIKSLFSAIIIFYLKKFNYENKKI